MSHRLTTAWRRLEALHRDFFVRRWQAGLQREAARHEDAFLALLFLDALGIDNPAAYETLDAYPLLAERFHRWHRRMGMESFGDPGVCC